MKRILYIALFEMFEIVDGMSIPVTICNEGRVLIYISSS
jgi:hypothetical protein